MIETDKFEHVIITSAAQLRGWLEAHHARTESIWLVVYKKSVPEKYVSVDEILDELLSFGWIDGIRRKLDADRTMQLVGPRRVHHWAQSYKDRAERLITRGRMHAAGLEAIAESKRRGLWDAMGDVDSLTVPPDLAAELSKHPDLTERFAGMAPSYRRNVLRFIKLAKTPPTRARRIAKAVQATARNEKMPQM
jgi:uncharacterized protein YdeI (YjbR/CyaY-like superfamily)